MSEESIIRNCAPTLAGIKTGSMFTCPCDSKEDVLSSLRDLNNRLVPKGVRLIPLRFSEKSALIYLYRPTKLKKDFAQTKTIQLLLEFGYDPKNCEKSLIHLIQKLRYQKVFPHEIGLFLGYPPEDVLGFIQNKAGGCKCVGYWKVYGNETAARTTFALYRSCTRFYCEQMALGQNVDTLTIPD